MILHVRASATAQAAINVRELSEGTPQKEASYLLGLEAGEELDLKLISLENPLEADADGDSIPDFEIVPEELPVANAGGHQVVFPNQRVTLDGSQSRSAEGGKARFIWRQIAGPETSLRNTDGSKPSFLAPRIPVGWSEVWLAFELTIAAGGKESRSSLATALVKPRAQACAGDCNGDDVVTIDEVIRGVNLIFGEQALETCPAFDADEDNQVTVAEVLGAIRSLLGGC